MCPLIYQLVADHIKAGSRSCTRTSLRYIPDALATNRPHRRVRDRAPVAQRPPIAMTTFPCHGYGFAIAHAQHSCAVLAIHCGNHGRLYQFCRAWHPAVDYGVHGRLFPSCASFPRPWKTSQPACMQGATWVLQCLNAGSRVYVEAHSPFGIKAFHRPSAAGVQSAATGPPSRCSSS